jgi:hypothetical protein
MIKVTTISGQPEPITMKRSELHTLPEYFDRYMLLCDDVTHLEALQTSLHELENFPVTKWEVLGTKTYAPGKWTIADIVQHLTDTERVFAYRALCFARGQREVKPFDEDGFAQMANAGSRNLSELINEAIEVRKATLSLYKSFSSEMLDRTGISFKGEYSVRHIGFIFPGHQRWHFRVMEERYLPLL